MLYKHNINLPQVVFGHNNLYVEYLNECWTLFLGRTSERKGEKWCKSEVKEKMCIFSDMM